jgi:L-ascorbate metabolism protein UlaG (beta-lactamase superfamily)
MERRMYFFCVLFSLFLILISKESTGSDNLSDTKDINNFLSSSLEKNEIAFMFLKDAGVIIRIEDQTIIIDPAASLSNEDINVLNAHGVNLLIYTHDHFDHFNISAALELFKGSQPFVVCEPGLADDLLKDKISDKKLISATPGKSFTFGKISLDAIKGLHSPYLESIYRMTIGGITIFHGGDSSHVSLVNYPSQLAFLPVGMDAIYMASDLKPQIIVGFHDSFHQSNDFNEKMNKEFPGIKIIIPKERDIKKVVIQK